jgi:hypothetical protein
MKTVAESLKEFSGKIKDLLTDLIQNHSEIYRWNTPSYDDSAVFVVGDYAWRDLKPEGKQIQSKLLNEYRHFYAILKTLLQGQPEDQLSELDEHHKTLLEIIEQNGLFLDIDKNKELNDATSALDSLLSLLDNVYDSGGSIFILVADTNALIYNPALESWAFDEIPAFTLALTPIALSELDSLKTNHRNKDVCNKATRLIRQIKEYRRRGRLSDGVPLRKGISTLKTFAREPNMANSLPWLQESNNDDRLLAYFIEIMRHHVRSKVLLVTGDINLQNKAEFARLPFLEPPD